MKTIDVNPLQDTCILLGKQGENLVRTIRFDVSAFISDCGDGVAQLLMLRPDEQLPYACTITRSDALYSWQVDSVATAIAGIGLAELRWYVGGAVAKSQLFHVHIIPALTDSIAQPPITFEEQMDAAIKAAGVAQGTLDKMIASAQQETSNVSDLIDELRAEKDNVQAVVNAANTAKSALQPLIAEAGTSQSNLQNVVDAAGQKQTALQGAVDDAGNAASELGNTIADATAAKSSLQSTIDAAGTKQSSLQQTVDNATAAKTSLDGAVSGANTARANLDTSASAANKAKSNLDTATTLANAAKTDLDASTKTANTAKTNLQTATTAANTAKSNLEKATAAANTAQEDLQALVDGMGVTLRPTLKASFSVASGSTATSKTMTVNMSALCEADIDLIIVRGKGVTVQIGGVAVLDTSVWNSVLASTDKVRLTATLQCRNGIYVKSLHAAPINASSAVLPVTAMGYLSASTSNDVSVPVIIASASGALAAGCEGEVWGR